jgi:hypothetical protein
MANRTDEADDLDDDNGFVIVPLWVDALIHLRSVG